MVLLQRGQPLWCTNHQLSALAAARLSEGPRESFQAERLEVSVKSGGGES